MTHIDLVHAATRPRIARRAPRPDARQRSRGFSAPHSSSRTIDRDVLRPRRSPAPRCAHASRGRFPPRRALSRLRCVARRERAPRPDRSRLDRLFDFSTRDLALSLDARLMSSRTMFMHARSERSRPRGDARGRDAARRERGAQGAGNGLRRADVVLGVLSVLSRRGRAAVRARAAFRTR